MDIKTAIQIRKKIRRDFANFKTMCRVGAINISLDEKIKKHRAFEAAIQSTYEETQ